MKSIFFLAALALSVISFAGTKEIKIGNFNEVKVYDGIELELVQADKNMVVISGTNHDGVEISLKNGKLKLEMSAKKSFDGEVTKVKLYYKHVDVIDVKKGSMVYSSGMIKQNTLELRADGGKIKVDVAVANLKVKARNGGVISGEGIEVNV